MTNTDHSTAVSGAEDRGVVEPRDIREHPCHGLFVSAGDRLSHRHWFQDNELMPTCERCGTPIDRVHKETGPVSWEPEKRRETAVQVADGWALVPIKPTEAMTNAGIRAWLGITEGKRPDWDTYVDRTYAAMLAASGSALAQTPDRAHAVREARAAARNLYLLQGDNARMTEALRQCRDQFAFYAREHYAAGKSEKGDTNTRFADIANDALTAIKPAATTSVPAISEPETGQ